MHFIDAEDLHLLHHSKDADAEWEVWTAVQLVLTLYELYTQVSSISSGLFFSPVPSYFT